MTALVLARSVKVQFETCGDGSPTSRNFTPEQNHPRSIPVPIRDGKSRRSLALQAVVTFDVNARPLRCTRGNALGQAMFDHLKVIGFSVGLLLILSGLNSVSFAISQKTTPKSRPAATVSFQSAQGSMVAGLALRAAAF